MATKKKAARSAPAEQQGGQQGGQDIDPQHPTAKDRNVQPRSAPAELPPPVPFNVPRECPD